MFKKIVMPLSLLLIQASWSEINDTPSPQSSEPDIQVVLLGNYKILNNMN